MRVILTPPWCSKAPVDEVEAPRKRTQGIGWVTTTSVLPALHAGTTEGPEPLGRAGVQVARRSSLSQASEPRRHLLLSARQLAGLVVQAAPDRPGSNAAASARAASGSTPRSRKHDVVEGVLVGKQMVELEHKPHRPCRASSSAGARSNTPAPERDTSRRRLVRVPRIWRNVDFDPGLGWPPAHPAPGRGRCRAAPQAPVRRSQSAS